MAAKTFLYRPRDADPARTIYVDGVEPGYRGLSHWPGNTTPGPLRHDLSTGSALAWADLDEHRREALLGPFDQVANNHYDTDGVLSAFVVLHPGQALPHRDLLLRAAATGDFATWNGPDALALELTVMRLTAATASPLADRLAGLDDEARHDLAYGWLIEQLPELLEAPFALQALWAGDHGRILEQVGAVEAGRDVTVERVPGVDLAIVTAVRELGRVALHHAAGPATRVLLVRPGRDGHRYRFEYRDESWFELVSRTPPARVPLEDVVRRLQAAEGPGPGAWWCDPIDRPVACLGHSTPGRRADGFFEDPHLGDDPPSRLDPEQVVATLRAAWAG